MRMPGRFRYSATLSRSGFTGKTFTCLIILSCTSRISISYSPIRTRVKVFPVKSMLDVVRKFGVEVIAETNVPLDPNVHQAIAMVESDDVAPGNVLGIMQKGYTLNGRTIRAAMVTVAKAKA